jgi:hypothetical protein
LNGLAGSGKSTIARTVARYFSDRQRLGASFFFSRGGGDVGHAGKFVTSIAVQLATSISMLRSRIRVAVLEDNEIASKSLRHQWNQLVSHNLSQLDVGSTPFIIVIDALDECEGEGDIRSILQLLAETNSTARLRIFLSSRPDIPIRLGFRAMPQIIHHDLVLHDVSRAAVNHDLATFFEEEFRKMRDAFEDLPRNWPGDDKINDLVQRSDGLFIYAATVCRFIKGEGQWLPQDLLDLVLHGTGPGDLSELGHDTPSQSPTWKLDEMYTQILQRSATNIKSEDKDRILRIFKQVMGSFVALAEPLSASTLASVLQMRPETVNLRVRHLHAILNVPQNQNHPIRLLHPSFRDFLLDKQRCYDQSFWVDEKQAHRLLADGCIRLMSASLKQDICGVDAPGTLVANVKRSQIDGNLSPEVQYACRYWIDHVHKSGTQLCDNSQVHYFLQKHFLHWLEALGWIGKISDGVHTIAALESFISVSISSAYKGCSR